jgi:Kef-type K+ transport system membrane component KefB
MWLLQLVIVIALCGVCGSLAERVGQSRVVGEIAAGLVLGPSVFGLLTPQFYDWIWGPAAPNGLATLGEVGLALLMFQVGLHLDLKPHRAASLKKALLISGLGMALPALGGAIVAAASKSTLAPDCPTVAYVMFCGIALAVSAVPVMARIIVDLRLSGDSSASHALLAAMITDGVGWIMVAAVAAIAVAEEPTSALVQTAAGLAAYGVSLALLSKFVVRPLLRGTRSSVHPKQRLTIVLCFVLLSSSATSLLGFHGAFGALSAALCVRNVPGLLEDWEREFSGFNDLVLMPVFFAYAGVHVSFEAIDGAGAWAWLLAFLLVGFAGKFGGSYLGARLAGCDSVDAALTGSLMNTRGLMELIVLSIGLQLRVLSTQTYTILFIFALVTTAMTVPLVRLVLSTRRSSRGYGLVRFDRE